MAIADSYGLFWNSDSGDRQYDAWVVCHYSSWMLWFQIALLISADIVDNSYWQSLCRPHRCPLHPIRRAGATA